MRGRIKKSFARPAKMRGRIFIGPAKRPTGTAARGRISFAEFLADLDIALNAVESKEWLKTMRIVRGR